MRAGTCPYLNALLLLSILTGLFLHRGQARTLPLPDSLRQVLVQATDSMQQATLSLPMPPEALKIRASAHNVRGVINRRMGRLDSALACYIRGGELLEKAGETNLLPMYTNIANLYLQQADYVSAKSYLQKAYALASQLPLGDNYAMLLNNFGDLYQKLGMLDSALFSYQESIRIASGTPSSRVLALALSNAASLYYSEGMVERARRINLRALAEAKRIGDPDLIGDCLLLSAKLALARGAYGQAECLIAEAWEVHAARGSVYDQAQIARTRYKLDSARGQYVAAIQHLQHYQQLKDSLFSVEKQEIALLDARPLALHSFLSSP